MICSCELGGPEVKPAPLGDEYLIIPHFLTVFLGFTGTFFSNSRRVGVNPKCIDDCTALEQANLTKLHTFATKHKVKTYSESFFSV